MPRLSEYLAETGGSDGAAAATALGENAELHRAHAQRVRQHGHRLYRQPDGTLAAAPPPRQPHTVANRKKWHGLVQHCRQQPGVDAQLQRSGLSARYAVNVSHDQHAAAMAVIGLSPEVGADGTWEGLQPDVADPLVEEGHALRHDAWRVLTRAVLERAVAVHGVERILEANSWQPGLYEASCQQPARALNCDTL